MVISLLVIPAIAVGLLAYFYGGETLDTFGGPIFDHIYAWLLPYKAVRIALGLSLILVNASLLNGIANRHNYAHVEHFFPVLIFFFFSVSDLSWVSLNPIQFANLFTLLALRRLLTIYRVTSPTAMLFDAGLFLGIGILFFPLLVFALPILWLGLMQLRSFNLREWLVPVVGVLTVVFYAVVAFWWFEYRVEIDEYLVVDTRELGFSFSGRHLYTYPFLVVTVVLAIVGLLQFISDMNVSTVHRKNSKSVFLWYALLILLMAIYASGLATDRTGFLGVFGPLVAVFGGIFFIGTKRLVILRSVFYLWLLFVMLHMYFTLVL